MLAFGRLIGGFVLMMVVGYIAVVALLPLPSPAATSDDVVTGRSAAIRLTEQARALVAPKPASSFQ